MTSRRYAVGLLALLALLPASLQGDDAPYAVVSAGAETDTQTGSLQNVGQTVIGRASSASLTMHAGIIPPLALAAVSFPCGDFDEDGDVDLDDFGSFAACYNGSARPPAPACPPGVDADCDGDGDVDLDDFGIFAANYTGAL